jgi:mono/diheme cytochrome c family protein
MFGTRSQSFVRQFLCCLLLSIGCTAFTFAADTDAWLTRFVETLNAGMPSHDNAGAEAFFASFKDRFILEFNDGGKVLEERVYVDRHLVAEQVADESTANPEAPATAADVQRGRLLYETHCIACHTTQAHWRDKHIVRSWADLLYQVTRMQNNAGQEWSMTEIIDVAAYLNELFYKMPCPVAGCRGSQARVDVHTVLAHDR